MAAATMQSVRRSSANGDVRFRVLFLSFALRTLAQAPENEAEGNDACRRRRIRRDLDGRFLGVSAVSAPGGEPHGFIARSPNGAQQIGDQDRKGGIGEQPNRGSRSRFA